MKLVFDIEANGLLDTVTKLHVLAIKDLDSNKDYIFRNNSKENNIEEGIKLLEKADEIIGHNIIGYDVPALQKLYPNSRITARQIDTLTLTRVAWSDLFMYDMKVNKRILPSNLCGSHSLKAWGYRLGVHKDTYGETADWTKWTQEMEDYCIQDVQVNTVLYKKILAQKLPELCVDIELKFNSLMTKQEHNGFKFNVEMAEILYNELTDKRERLEKELQESIPPTYVELKTKTKVIPFNPGSTQQIAKYLQTKYNWSPNVLTPKGSPKVTEAILSSLDYPECPKLIQYMQLKKILGMLKDGPTGWLKLVKNGRIHGHVNTGGTVTGRCTHTTPNVAQVPSSRRPHGSECRKLFGAPEGKVLVGCDASGLESRCLAHFLFKYDNGKFRDELLNGDIHTANAKAFGGIDRDTAKTALYAMMYGCSPKKLATILSRPEYEGKAILDNYFKVWPQMKKLIEDVQERASSRGYLYGLDKRKLPVRSEHAALNTLLQSAGAVIMKTAALILSKDLSEAGLLDGTDYMFVANVHDEFQLEVQPEHAKIIAELSEESIRKAGRFFNFNCPLDAEAKIGKTWAETH